MLWSRDALQEMAHAPCVQQNGERRVIDASLAGDVSTGQVKSSQEINKQKQKEKKQRGKEGKKENSY
jgi:hypothetical protein